MKKIKKVSIIIVAVIGLMLGLGGTTGIISNAAESSNQVDVLVGFAQIPGPNEQALVHNHGGEIKYSYHLVPAIAANIPESAITGLLKNPRVKSINIDGKVYAVDTELDNTWGVKRIDSGIVHNNGNKGADVKIGIIDSGIDYTHKDLYGVYAGGYDFVQNDTAPMDVYGHGTHVAGTACAEDNDLGVVGVAPESALYSLRVLNDDGVGYWSDIVAAMEWAVDSNMQVVNLSIGKSQDPGAVVKAAFDNAETAGIVIVAAAGNSGNFRGRGDNVIYPAKFDSVIAVAATDLYDKRASWSSTGYQVELSAPGVAVLSAWNNDSSYHNPQPVNMDGDYYKQASGTSMASPHVAGVAALVISAGITDINGNGRINDEVRGILTTTAEDIGKKGRDTHYGFGLVNAAMAVNAVGSDAPAEPTIALVDSITYSTEGGRNQDKHLFISIVIVDDFNNAVSDALVSIDLYRDDNFAGSGSGVTDIDGILTFSLKNAKSGYYKTTVTNVVAEGLIWNDTFPENIFCKM